MSDDTIDINTTIGTYADSRDVTDPVALAKKKRSRILTFRKLIAAAGTEVADGAAGTATAETRGFRFPFNGIVTGIQLTCHAAVAGDAANGFTMTVSKRDAAGANLTTLGTISSVNAVPATGNFVAFVGKPFTLTNANLQVVAGGYCTWSIAKPGAGVIVPTFDCDVTVLDQ
jgi:hypothetical protein